MTATAMIADNVAIGGGTILLIAIIIIVVLMIR